MTTCNNRSVKWPTTVH